MFLTKNDFSYTESFSEWHHPNLFEQKTKIHGYNAGVYARNSLQEESLPVTEDRACRKEIVLSWTP